MLRKWNEIIFLSANQNFGKTSSVISSGMNQPDLVEGGGGVRGALQALACLQSCFANSQYYV